MNYKFYSYSVIFNHKYMQKLEKIKIYLQLNCVCDQNSVDFSLKILKISLKFDTV